MTSEWIRNQAAAFSALEGRVVRSWRGTEMCVRGGEDGVPAVFEDPAVPCLQLWTLHADTGGLPVAVVTYQGAEDFGLRVLPQPPPLRDDADGILRTRDLTELPTGRIEDVAVYLDADEIAEISMRVGGQPLLLLAGESTEGWSGDVSWHRLDESVLVFTDPAAVEAVAWTPPRDPQSLRRL